MAGSKYSEKEIVTGELYSNCFEQLNESEAHRMAQGDLLTQQLGISAEIVKGKKCLDGGCGPGTMTYRFITMGAGHATGVDLSPTPKESIFDKYKDRFSFVKGSLLNLPFADNTFDLVASTGVLQHTANPERALTEMIRILKPGNTLYLGVYGKYGIFSWVLSLARLFTVKLRILPKVAVDRLLGWLGFGPLVRYQFLDYLYVPYLFRFSPQELKDWFVKYGMVNPRRIYNVSVEEARIFRKRGTVYTYDPRTIMNRILFGYGFINMHADKP
ncbi:MAG TPA: class I SAM-dependent methyltransferase [Candidatus Paceibacterota bacterium]